MVKINDMNGNERSIEYGVSQSSVKGSDLLILYVNSICECKLDDIIAACAIDICLLFFDK
jgi:hypothetical protein